MGAVYGAISIVVEGTSILGSVRPYSGRLFIRYLIWRQACQRVREQFPPQEHSQLSHGNLRRIDEDLLVGFAFIFMSGLVHLGVLKQPLVNFL